MTKFNRIFPWYDGLSGDLLFWVAIDTLFLTVVKNFNAPQIVSLTTVSLITCIALQVPLLKIIMSLGYIIILFIRDPFKVYMQDLALRNIENRMS